MPHNERMLRAVFRFVRHLYFRVTEVVGEAPTTSTRGRLFAANHVNGLIDPILVMTKAPCPIAPLAKSTLWKVPVLRWLLDAVDAVPVHRRKDDPQKDVASNAAMFDRVAEHLGRGGNVLVFPEGTSHNEPHLSPLKSGAGRMLARAYESGARELTFQAVGLEFDARDTFRSRALIVYGPVRSVDALALAAVGDRPEESLARAITEQLRLDLGELIVEGATWEEHRLIARVATLFANESGDRTLATWNEIGRKVEAARRSMGDDDPRHRRIALAVARYDDALDATGLTDDEVLNPTRSEPKRRRRGALLLLTLPLAIPGATLYALPYRIPRLVARRLAKGGADEVSTYKLATGLVVYPLWALGLAASSLALLPPPLSLAGVAVVFASPFAALRWLDHLEQRRRSNPASTLDFERIRAIRGELSELLADARRSFAPDQPSVVT